MSGAKRSRKDKECYRDKKIIGHIRFNVFKILTLRKFIFISMKKAVIFDMDGVLVDNRDIHIDAFEIFCDRHGLKFDRAIILKSFGQVNKQIFENLLGKGTLTDQQIIDYGLEKEDIYREIFDKKIEPAKGLVRFLKSLKERGVKIAVGSSGPLKNVQYVLDRCGIAEYFDAIAHGDIVKNGKPDPEIFLLAAELLGVTPDECIVFEDAFVGIEAANRAGMTIIALATTFPREQLTGYDMLIDDFTEIDSSILDKF